jgi:hypothetical protein
MMADAYKIYLELSKSNPDAVMIYGSVEFVDECGTMIDAIKDTKINPEIICTGCNCFFQK